MEEVRTRQKVVLLACNIILLIFVITFSGMYAGYIRREQEKAKVADFINTVESMKQVSQNYLDSERGYVKNWSSYISENNMDMEEALDFIRLINTNKKRYVHIVDMDTFDAYSAYYPAGKEQIDTYHKYKTQKIESEKLFADTMQAIFDGTNEEFNVLGKYQLSESLSTAVAVGTRVTLRTETGHKDYLLLRIIPTEILKKSWVFPMEYSSAEVGIITRDGDYVMQSSSMKSISFPEYIRGYNFQDDYNAAEKLKQQFQNTTDGVLRYKNFRNQDCLWYYSSFGADSTLDILGMVNMDELKVSTKVWYIVVMICITFIALAALDGVYLLKINKKLRVAVKAAQQASKAKTEFLSAMSHDMRTPLNAILGMMTIARKNADNSQYVAECIDKAMRSGKQLLTLINDVLDISKIESGKVTLNPEEVCINDVIQDIMEMLEPHVQQKSIKIQTDFENISQKYVYADRMRLSQIYVNLLSNAVKYTDKGGSISVKLSEETEALDKGYVKLIFSVSDTGIGMTEEFQKNMYNSFTREINTQVNEIQGTGLGLAIVKQMVDLMGGSIECNSARNEGTTFTVSIDLRVVNQQKTAALNKDEDISIDGMHVLVVEDNDLNWEIIEVLLKEYKVTCDRAENGKRALEILCQSAPDTYAGIFMDVQMPVMNGLEATRCIRKLNDERISHIPIVAMTADAFAEDVQACMECGMNGHMAKPVDTEKLASYLRKIKQNKF